MQIDLGFNVDIDVLFDAMKNSQIMQQKDYELLYENSYNTQQHGQDGRGLCYVDKDGDQTYIHVRIYGKGQVSSFEYHSTLDVNNTADNDVKDLADELKKKLRSTP